MDDTKNSITVSQKKAEELYSSLERLWFPKWATNNYGIIQSRDTFNIRIFRPDWSPLSMLVSKDEVKFNFYAKNYGYIAIWLPNHK
jgi:hypothetical protein